MIRRMFHSIISSGFRRPNKFEEGIENISSGQHENRDKDTNNLFLIVWFSDLVSRLYVLAMSLLLLFLFGSGPTLGS